MSDAERYVAAMGKVPLAQPRLAAYAATFTAVDNAQTADMILSSYAEACECLNNSPTFHAILSITLTIGNFLNQGGPMGNAQGFRLAFLNKLGDTRTQDGKASLLEYITRVLVG